MMGEARGEGRGARGEGLGIGNWELGIRDLRLSLGSRKPLAVSRAATDSRAWKPIKSA
jgi:hypothetical protein